MRETHTNKQTNTHTNIQIHSHTHTHTWSLSPQQGWIQPQLKRLQLRVSQMDRQPSSNWKLYNQRFRQPTTDLMTEGLLLQDLMCERW